MQKTGARYSQIATYYQELVDKQQLVEGDRMPTEEEICRLFNVSRITVRQAMNDLAQAGYIVRMQGKGSFVRMKKTDMQLNRLQGFSEEMRAKGMVPSTKTLEAKSVACDRKVGERLKLEPGTQVISMIRVRFADDIPMAVEHVHIPFFLCPGLLSMDLSGSLYQLLSNKYHLEPVRASQDIEAGHAGKPMAELLQMKQNSPALIIERVSFLENDMPLEYVVSVYRGDRYSFHVDMHRKDR